MGGFDKFCIDKNYILIKNSLFNYLNRKKSIRSLFFRIKYKGKIFLDIGSGLSPVTPIPQKTMFMDISKEALYSLKKQGYITKYGDITKIPLKSNSAGVIFCSEVLEHVDNYKKAISELHRVLKVGGSLIISVPVYKKYWGFDDAFVGHIRRFEPKIFEKEIKAVGLKIIEEKPIGSEIERAITKLSVKLFKNQKDKKEFSSIKLLFFRWINYFLYLIVRFSLMFNSKESTSIMLYLLEK